MDAMIVVRDGRLLPPPARCKGGRPGRRRHERHPGHSRSEGTRPASFAFMSNEISSERQVETAVYQTAGMMRQAREEAKE